MIKRIHIACLAPLCALAAFTAAAQTTSNTTQPATPKRIALSSTSMSVKRLDHTDPLYPREARERHIAGTVLIHVVISTSGIPPDLIVVASAGLLLNRAALDAVKQFRYAPIAADGEPVEVETTISVMFGLNGPAPPPVVPDIKVDIGWVKSRREAIAALDSTQVGALRRLFEANGLTSAVLKNHAAQFLANNTPTITAYFRNKKDSDVIARDLVAKLSNEIDGDFLHGLMQLVYAQYVSAEQAEAALANPDSEAGRRIRTLQPTLQADIDAAMHDYCSKVLVPEIDTEIRRINKN